MHLRISRDPRFQTEVTASQPTLEGPVEVTFNVRFKALSYSELEAYGATADDNARFLRDVLVGADVAGDDDEPLPWTEGLRDRLIDTPWLRGPLLRAFRLGLAGAARGN